MTFIDKSKYPPAKITLNEIRAHIENCQVKLETLRDPQERALVGIELRGWREKYLELSRERHVLNKAG